MARRLCVRYLFLVLCFAHTIIAERPVHSPGKILRGIPDQKYHGDGAEGDDKFYKFITRPDIRAPKWDVTIYDPDAISPGYWFVAPYKDINQKDYQRWNGPYIYDGIGELIWSGAPMFKYYNTYDFRTAQVGGEQMATLISRKDEEGVIFDSSYQFNATVDMVGFMPQWLRDSLGAGERLTNMHDFNVIDDGKRILMLTKVWENATVEESKAIGFNGNCTAKWQGLKEIDATTGEPLFEWSAHGHISLEESTKEDKIRRVCNGKLGRGGWDILHLNSVDKFPDGDYLISARHADALYKISYRDGSIMWRLGGVKSDFELRGNARFSRQHHARVHQQNQTHAVISVFDNARGDGRNEHPSNKYSRGLVLVLRTDTKSMTAEVLAEYRHPLDEYTFARGSVQLLEDDNVFICWSENTLVSEHTPDGNIIYQASFKLEGANSYRAYKFPWVGRPHLPPDVHSIAESSGDNATTTLVHVSWNGCTDIASWNMYRTDAEGSHEELIASQARRGFETALSYRGHASFVVLEALDLHGEPLGRSNVQTTILPENVSTSAVNDETQWPQDQTLQDSPFSKVAEALQNLIVVFIFATMSFAAATVAIGAVWCSKRGLELLQNASKRGYEPIVSGMELSEDLGAGTLVNVDPHGDEETERGPDVNTSDPP